jgi:hypothetical protein
MSGERERNSASYCRGLPDPRLWDAPTKDTGLREWGHCAGCDVQGRLLKDPEAFDLLWCRDCGGAGPE